MSTPAPLCTHVMPSGATCGSCAVSGTALCYHHSAIKTALDKAGNASNIPFVFPEDRAALQINYFLLLQAFAAGRIDLRTFNSMQRVLRAMATNFGKTPLSDNHTTAAAPSNAGEPSEVAAPEKETKKPAPIANATRVDSPAPPKTVSESSTRQKTPAAPAFLSFEEIAAQHKPFGPECFLISTNQPRFSAQPTR